MARLSRFLLAATVTLAASSLALGFVVPRALPTPTSPSAVRARGRGRGLAVVSMSSTEIDESSLGLTPRLLEVSRLFQLMDDRARVQQLLALAASLKPFKDFRKLPENKVPGCLSTVYVHAYLQDGKVFFEGDSDAQLTKGLVALLVDGLSGYAAHEIQAVKPEFVKFAGIAASLTPGRNNGFLNMLAMMKRKAVEAEAKGEGAGQEEPEVEFEEDITRPVYSSMMKKLINFLKPKRLELADDSAQHAGHAGAKGLGGESHFSLKIVADCFDGLSLVQRHKLIYTVLGAEMEQIHALAIDAKTPEEAGL